VLRGVSAGDLGLMQTALAAPKSTSHSGIAVGSLPPGGRLTRLLITGVLFLTLVTSCTETPRAFSSADLTPGQGEAFLLPEVRSRAPGKALAVIYRPFRMHGDECFIDVYWDGVPVGDLAVREYLVVPSDPGDHVLLSRVSAGECAAQRNAKPVTVDGGKVYCFYASIDLIGGLQRVPESVALREISCCRLSASRAIR
jgi:hypothetical protein